MTIGSKEEVVAGLRVQVRDTADPVAREMLCAVQAITTGLTQYKLWHAGVLSLFRAAAKFLSMNTVSPAQTVYGIPQKEIKAWLEACKDADDEVIPHYCSACPCCGNSISQESSHGCHVFLYENKYSSDCKGVYVVAACGKCNTSERVISGCPLALHVAAPGNHDGSWCAFGATKLQDSAGNTMQSILHIHELLSEWRFYGYRTRPDADRANSKFVRDAGQVLDEIFAKPNPPTADDWRRLFTNPQDVDLPFEIALSVKCSNDQGVSVVTVVRLQCTSASTPDSLACA